MRRKKTLLSISVALIALLVLLLDTKTATEGAKLGIDLCLRVIIPALFPFFIITTYLNTALLGLNIPGMQQLGKRLKVPIGGSSLLLLGLIGGYPVGAQLIGETYRKGKLDRKTGQILLGYCSNAGPAFIFGITGMLFTSKWIPLFLWLVHLLSAISVGCLLPKPNMTKLEWNDHNPYSLAASLRNSICICASVCGWVVVFKMILTYANKWLFPYFGDLGSVLGSGILELSNGCLGLMQLESEPLRFIICAAFLGFGGFCVVLQTISVTESLGLGLYIPGKVIHACISIILAIPAAYFLFISTEIPARICVILLISACSGILLTLLLTKNKYGNLK